MASEQLFIVGNFVRPTTAAPVKQATGATVRTMLQLATIATEGIYIVEWGISFDGSAAATPVNVELFGTTVAASGLTALAAADVQNFSAPALPAVSALQYGAALTGFAAAAPTEGTVANYRPIDNQLIAPTSQYVKQWPLGREPAIAVSTFVRIRVTAPATVNALMYIVFGEQ